MYTETVPSRGGVRPGNPTPAHAQGQGSPAPIRPQNPTPVHAGKDKTGRPSKRLLFFCYLKFILYDADIVIGTIVISSNFLAKKLLVIMGTLHIYTPKHHSTKKDKLQNILHI